MKTTRFTSLLALLALSLPASARTPPVIAFEVPAENGLQAQVWAEGLNHPWSIAWLPDGRALVTERPGRLRIISTDGQLSPPVAGVPAVAAVGQGGLLDVALHPEFARNQLIYLTYLSGNESANRIALARGRLVDGKLADVVELLHNPVAKPQGQNLGSRLLWLPDGSLLMSVGDGGNNVYLDGGLIRNKSQQPNSWFGKILRLTAEGKPAPGNPGLGAQRGKWDPHVWTLGNRNAQGLARDSKTGIVWATEHGARGGDELNRIAGGHNYGWPEVTYSREYSGLPITSVRARAGVTDPVSVWIPSIAPSGLAIYRARAIPSLSGAILAGGLRSEDVRIIRLDARGQPQSEHRLRLGARVRDVRVGPDGLVYVLTDEGKGQIIRLRAKASDGTSDRTSD